jgi:glycosyl transferase family 25
MSRVPQIPIFLVNLDRSKDRLQAYEDQMSTLGLVYERVPAVDGNCISKNDADELSRTNVGGFPWEKGAMGCFLSHRKVWKMIIEREEEWTFISEDDIHLSEVKHFFSQRDWIPNDADLIKAETMRTRVVVSKALDIDIPGHRLRRLESTHLGTGGYFIKRKTAKLLYEATRQLSGPIDHVMFDSSLEVFGKITVYQVDPAICVQDMHLRNGPKKHFKSLLDLERQNLNINNQNATNSMIPKDWAKVWREIARPFRRIRESNHYLRENGTKGSVIKKIPYAGDSKAQK